MTMVNDLVLRCSGVTCGGVVIPEFGLPQGSTYGISVPAPFGEDWIIVMKTLSGELENSNIELFNPGVLVLPQLGLQRYGDDATVGDVLRSLGRSENDFEAIHARATSLTTVRQLRSTPRLFIELLGALQIAKSLLVFSTAGLDPVGVKEANQLVKTSGVAGLHLFATSLSSFYCQENLFDKVVECTVGT